MEMANHRYRVGTILSQQQFEKISGCLLDLAEKLRVSAVLLVNSSGRVVTQKIGSSWKVDSTLLSTLTASSYAAAKEIARLLGEKDNFKMVLHEGKDHNVYVSTVNENFFLIVAFESGVALGMVRLFTKRTISQLLPVLSEEEEGGIRLEHVFDRKFQTLLGDELDRTFKEE